MIRTVAMSFGLALVGFAPIARAEQPQQQEDPKPCAADAERLCHGIPTGGGAVAACLKAHKSELSPQCKMNIFKAAEKHEEQKAADPMQQPMQQPMQHEAPNPQQAPNPNP
jgi:hypothetical protein